MSGESPWAHIDRLKSEQERVRTELDHLGWSMVEPNDVFLVARRRAWKGWPKDRHVRAMKPAELLAKVKQLEAEHAAELKAKSAVDTGA